MSPRPIRATGPTPCDRMLIAERPGIEESRRGVVLCGPSGQETDRFLLNNAGIPRESIYCTNLVKDYRDGENPEEWEIERDWPQLVEEVLAVRPRYIMLMGLYAARAFLGRDLDLEWAHGLAFPLHWNALEFTVMPVIHTAATLHQPKYAAQCADDFTQFGRMVRGEEMPRGHLKDNYPNPTYFETTVQGRYVSSTLAVDTEGTVEHPWCFSVTASPGFGAVDRNICTDISAAELIVLHNSLHDLPVLAAMGVIPSNFTDTLLMASLLQLDPQGLKPLARRYCGMKMSDYDTVIAPARRDKALEYLGRVLDYIERQQQPGGRDE